MARRRYLRSGPCFSQSTVYEIMIRVADIRVSNIWVNYIPYTLVVSHPWAAWSTIFPLHYRSTEVQISLFSLFSSLDLFSLGQTRHILLRFIAAEKLTKECATSTCLWGSGTNPSKGIQYLTAVATFEKWNRLKTRNDGSCHGAT